MVTPVIHQEHAARRSEELKREPLKELSGAEAMVYTDYMWVDISDWDFSRMHEELRDLGAQGWELDGVVDDLQGASAHGGGGPGPVSLRLKRQRKY